MSTHSATPGDTASIVPIWSRLRDVWRYPLHSDPLMTIGIATAIVTLTGWLPLSWLIELGVLAYVYRYGTAILIHTANGYDTPPEHTMQVNQSRGWDQIRLLGVFMLVGALAAVFVPFPLDVIIIFLLLCGYPAATMVVAIDGHVLVAGNLPPEVHQRADNNKRDSDPGQGAGIQVRM